MLHTSCQTLSSTSTPTCTCLSSARSTTSVATEMAPISNSSTVTLTGSSSDSCDLVRDERIEPTAGNSIVSAKSASPAKCVSLSAYYTFSEKSSKVIQEESQGLSGFLEYRKLNGTWRPFLFQTIGYQLALYRIHSTHQVLIMSTDIRNASEIALEHDGVCEESRLLRLGFNGTTITLRAVTHRAALYWVDGLQRLRNGKPLQVISDSSCAESEDDIFVEIDKLLSLREWTPPPSSAPLCGLYVPTGKPQPPAAGMLAKSEKTLVCGVLPGCKIC